MPCPIYDESARSAVREFAKSILHGDAVHRAWLLEAAENFVNGKTLPDVRPNLGPQNDDAKMLDFLLSEEGQTWLYWKMEHAEHVGRADIKLAMPL